MKFSIFLVIVALTSFIINALIGYVYIMLNPNFDILTTIIISGVVGYAIGLVAEIVYLRKYK